MNYKILFVLENNIIVADDDNFIKVLDYVKNLDLDEILLKDRYSNDEYIYKNEKIEKRE